MHYMDTDRDEHDMNTHETIDMDSSGSHCLKLERFIAKRRAKIKADLQRSIDMENGLIDDDDIDDTYHIRRKSRSPSIYKKADRGGSMF